MITRSFTFLGGSTGSWKVINMETIAGEPLPEVAALDISPGLSLKPSTEVTWQLRGITSNERYVEQEEKRLLVTAQAGLGRVEAVHAALIPIRKNSAWWSLPQDERRKIFEAQSHHINIGMKFLPAIARRLHHCRDLSEHEPFDFLTWFEFAPEQAAQFDLLLKELRATPEWEFVDREIDIRLVKA